MHKTPSKKDRMLPVKEMLFTYLAVSKAIYWVETAGGFGAGQWLQAVQAVLLRLLTRDFMLVLMVIMFFALEKLLMKNGENLRKSAAMYIVGYAGLIALWYMQLGIARFFVEVTFPPLGELIRGTVGGFAVVIGFLNFKMYLKSKEKETYKAADAAEAAKNPKKPRRFTMPRKKPL